APLRYNEIILGIPWLSKTNPIVDWKNGTVKIKTISPKANANPFWVLRTIPDQEPTTTTTARAQPSGPAAVQKISTTTRRGASGVRPGVTSDDLRTPKTPTKTSKTTTLHMIVHDDAYDMKVIRTGHHGHGTSHKGNQRTNTRKVPIKVAILVKKLAQTATLPQ